MNGGRVEIIYIFPFVVSLSSHIQYFCKRLNLEKLSDVGDLMKPLVFEKARRARTAFVARMPRTKDQPKRKERGACD